MTMPRSEDFAAAPASSGPFVVPPTVVGLLTQTRPWVKLVSVLAFLGCGVGGLGIMLLLVVRPFARGERLLLLVPTSLMLLFYLLPAAFLWQYAASIRLLQRGGGLPAREDALVSQRKFWKFVGITAAIIMAGYALVVGIPLLLGLFRDR